MPSTQSISTTFGKSLAKLRSIKTAIRLRLFISLMKWFESHDLPIHDRTLITQCSASWLAQERSTEAGEFLLKPAAQAAFNILARSASVGGDLKASSSQCGEDLIIQHIFMNRGINQPSYLDIGAHHPRTLSNTAIFYAAGSRGINVEPNPQLIGEFHQSRPDDVNLQYAISDFNGYVQLLIPRSSAALATILESQLPDKDHDVVRVPCLTLRELLHRYAGGCIPDLLSLDVEGHDMNILWQLPELSTLPKVICVETVAYSPTGHGSKHDAIITFVINLGYTIYADTSINTIFVLKAFWDQEKRESRPQ